jgi:CBS domain containing-hemolysin-like protein
VIHAKDLLREVDRLVRGEGDTGFARRPRHPQGRDEALFRPDTTALDEQMRQFLKRRTHFALVVDEYGALRG